MFFLRRLWLFLLTLLHSGHLGGSWVYAGMMAEKERREKKQII